MNWRGTGGDEDLFTAQLDLPVEGGRIFLPIFQTQIDLDRMHARIRMLATTSGRCE
jgi:hypothetical protein